MKLTKKQLALVVSGLKAARFHILWQGESEIGSSVIDGIDGSLQFLDPKGMCDGCGVRPAMYKNEKITPTSNKVTRLCTPCRDRALL